MGRYTEKPNRYRIFWKTDTDTDVGIWKTENTEKPTKKKRNIGYFGISEATVAVLHNALKNVVELIKCNAYIAYIAKLHNANSKLQNI